MTIKDLKLMNETERILWFANAKAKDFGIVLKNEGIKGVSKLKKAEKLAMVLDLVVESNVTDEEIDKVVEDTKKLTEELNVRQSYEEEFEATLYARLCAKEITWQEFKQTVINRNVSIPINVADEAYTKESIALTASLGGLRFRPSNLKSSFWFSNRCENTPKYFVAASPSMPLTVSILSALKTRCLHLCKYSATLSTSWFSPLSRMKRRRML